MGAQMTVAGVGMDSSNTQTTEQLKKLDLNKLPHKKDASGRMMYRFLGTPWEDQWLYYLREPKDPNKTESGFTIREGAFLIVAMHNHSPIYSGSVLSNPRPNQGPPENEEVARFRAMAEKLGKEWAEEQLEKARVLSNGQNTYTIDSENFKS